METPESIERILEKRLVPCAFSVEGSAALESLIDELAGESPQPSVRWGRYLVGAAAAALMMFAGIAVWIPTSEVPAVAEVNTLFAEPHEVVLIEDVEGVISAEENDGLVADADGSLHRAWLVQVVSEERFRDEESGQEVRVVSPRDEIVLMPVTSF
ncbi:hypothetical protein ACFQY0_00065 [Haloferula chungangensis]|uniref:Anti-sigma factor n=1 Tax=Haloferula chungangensis TaxID=1048331 RepID=A0ABW2L249_9BACT